MGLIQKNDKLLNLLEKTLSVYGVFKQKDTGCQCFLKNQSNCTLCTVKKDTLNSIISSVWHHHQFTYKKAHTGRLKSVCAYNRLRVWSVLELQLETVIKEEQNAMTHFLCT